MHIMHIYSIKLKKKIVKKLVEDLRAVGATNEEIFDYLVNELNYDWKKVSKHLG